MAKQPAPWKAEWWPVEKPQDYPGNPRLITEADVDAVAASIKAFGWRQPIVVDTEGVIVIGHTRRRAGHKLGMTHVPVHVAADLTADQIRALRLADNRTGENAQWLEDLLAQELRGLQEISFDLALTGFGASEIDHALKGWEPDPKVVDAVEAELAELKSVIKVRCSKADEGRVREAVAGAIAEIGSAAVD